MALSECIGAKEAKFAEISGTAGAATFIMRSLDLDGETSFSDCHRVDNAV
jgi:hypothetical protein